jgi:hypothetical protein
MSSIDFSVPLDDCEKFEFEAHVHGAGRAQWRSRNASVPGYAPTLSRSLVPSGHVHTGKRRQHQQISQKNWLRKNEIRAAVKRCFDNTQMAIIPFPGATGTRWTNAIDPLFADGMAVSGVPQECLGEGNDYKLARCAKSRAPYFRYTCLRTK